MPDIDKVLSMLASEKPAIRARAATMVLQRVEAPLEALLKILDEFPDSEFRQPLVEQLCRKNADEVPAEMVVRLASQNPAVRVVSCAILARIGDSDSIPYLLPLISDSDADVRTAAGQAIGRLGDSPALDVITLKRVCYYDEVLLTGPTSFFEPFPDPSDVFSKDVESHAKYILPLATVDLGQVDPALPHRVHFLVPLEPSCGVVGEDSADYFSHLCRSNYVGYQYEGDRCHLATDFRYFELARLESAPELSVNAREALTDHYERVRAGFSRVRKRFQKTGELSSVEDASLRMAEQIGGRCDGGNWAESGDFPLMRGEATLPLTRDGRPFIFVGNVYVANYVCETVSYDCNLLLFYDPDTRQSLTTFDWS